MINHITTHTQLGTTSGVPHSVVLKSVSFSIQRYLKERIIIITHNSYLSPVEPLYKNTKLSDEAVCDGRLPEVNLAQGYILLSSKSEAKCTLRQIDRG